MGFRPRKRAERQTPRVTSWPSDENTRLLGFAGYKAGMTHVLYLEEGKSHLKGKEVFVPVTVIETPPIVVYGIRFYKNGQVVTDYLTDDSSVLSRLKFKKRMTEKKEQSIPEDFDDVRVLVFTQPGLTGIGKKRVERMEIAIGGSDKNEKLEYAKSLLGKEVRVADVLSPGEYVDVIAVTKGKGWQGVVKRFGVPLNPRKATGRRRHGGVLGAFKPPYVMWTVPRAGQMGYHKRTDLNKLVVKIGSKDDPITPKGGFPHYGVVRNDYVLIYGSVPGPKKRLIRLRKAVRQTKQNKPLKITYVSLEAQN